MTNRRMQTGERKCHTITNIHTLMTTSILIIIHTITYISTLMWMKTEMNIHTHTSTTTALTPMTTGTFIQRSIQRLF